MHFPYTILYPKITKVFLLKMIFNFTCLAPKTSGGSSSSQCRLSNADGYPKNLFRFYCLKIQKVIVNEMKVEV